MGDVCINAAHAWIVKAAPGTCAAILIEWKNASSPIYTWIGDEDWNDWNDSPKGAYFGGPSEFEKPTSYYRHDPDSPPPPAYYTIYEIWRDPTQ